LMQSDSILIYFYVSCSPRFPCYKSCIYFVYVPLLSTYEFPHFLQFKMNTWTESHVFPSIWELTMFK
jgi:hypothetical protein